MPFHFSQKKPLNFPAFLRKVKNCEKLPSINLKNTFSEDLIVNFLCVGKYQRDRKV